MTSQYGVRVSRKARTDVDLTVFSLSEDSPVPPDPTEVGFFARALSDVDIGRDSPIAARIDADGGALDDGGWLSANVGRYIRSVERLSARNLDAKPRFSSLSKKKRTFVGEERLPQAVFRVEVTDESLLAHVEEQDVWESVAYGHDLFDAPVARPAPRDTSDAPGPAASPGASPQERVQTLLAAAERAGAFLDPYASRDLLVRRAAIEAKASPTRVLETLERAAGTLEPDAYFVASAADVALDLALARDPGAAAVAQLVEGMHRGSGDYLPEASLAAVWTVLGDGVRAAPHVAREKKLRKEGASDDVARAARYLAARGETRAATALLEEHGADDHTAGPAITTLLSLRGEQEAMRSAEALLGDEAANLVAGALFTRGQGEAAFALVERASYVSPLVEGSVLGAALDAGHEDRVRAYLVRRYEAASADGNGDGMVAIALTLTRVDCGAARPYLGDLVGQAAHMQMESSLAALAECARRCSIDVAPIRDSVKGPKKKMAVAVGAALGSEGRGDFAAACEEARALARAPKRAFREQLAVAQALAASGDVESVAWLRDLGPTLKGPDAYVDLGDLARAQYEVGDVDGGLATLERVKTKDRRSSAASTVAIEAARRGAVPAALRTMELIDPEARASVLLACAEAAAEPGLAWRTRLTALVL